ncbi:hypothetical protein ACWD8L_00745 [Streptomyces sp. NPDC005133]
MTPRLIPGIAAFARGGLPAEADTDDGKRWVDGYCWLYCGQKRPRVVVVEQRQIAKVRVDASLSCAAF